MYGNVTTGIVTDCKPQKILTLVIKNAFDLVDNESLQPIHGDIQDLKIDSVGSDFTVNSDFIYY